MGNLCGKVPSIDADADGNSCCNPSRCTSSCCANDVFFCCATLDKGTLAAIGRANSVKQI